MDAKKMNTKEAFEIMQYLISHSGATAFDAAAALGAPMFHANLAAEILKGNLGDMISSATSTIARAHVSPEEAMTALTEAYRYLQWLDMVLAPDGPLDLKYAPSPILDRIHRLAGHLLEKVDGNPNEQYVLENEPLPGDLWKSNP